MTTTKKRTKKLAEQYVLTRDEMQTLVGLLREVKGLMMGPVDYEGQDPDDRTGLPYERYFKEGGYFSWCVSSVDEVLHNHGIKL
jgi:hypothetical protein